MYYLIHKIKTKLQFFFFKTMVKSVNETTHSNTLFLPMNITCDEMFSRI